MIISGVLVTIAEFIRKLLPDWLIAILATLLFCVVFYEGLPLANRIPYISEIPLVGRVLAGRMGLAVDQAFERGQKTERSIWAENRAKELARQYERRRIAQIEADEIAKDNIAEVARLEEQLRQIRESLSDANINPDDFPDGHVFSDRVRERLNAISSSPARRTGPR